MTYLSCYGALEIVCLLLLLLADLFTIYGHNLFLLFCSKDKVTLGQFSGQIKTKMFLCKQTSKQASKND